MEDYVSDSLDKTIQYYYDPMGNLIKRVEDGSSTTTYVQDLNSGLPVVLIEETSSYTAKYTYGKDRLKVSRSGEYYYFYDGLGSTRTITDTSGVVKARYVYDVYGKTLSSESYEDASIESQPFLFTGELYDPDTEHIYLRARWYDPGIGRFLTRDTYQGEYDDPKSQHRYGYCEGDPANLTDPTGNCTLVGQLVVTAIRSIARSITAPVYIGFLRGFGFGAAAGALSGYIEDPGNWKHIIKSAFWGGIIGGITGGASELACIKAIVGLKGINPSLIKTFLKVLAGKNGFVGTVSVLSYLGNSLAMGREVTVTGVAAAYVVGFVGGFAGDKLEKAIEALPSHLTCEQFKIVVGNIMGTLTPEIVGAIDTVYPLSERIDEMIDITTDAGRGVRETLDGWYREVNWKIEQGIYDAYGVPESYR